MRLLCWAGVPDYMKPCNADGTMGPWDNVTPYSLHALLPGAAAQRSFHLRLQGWAASALYTVKPQKVEVGFVAAVDTRTCCRRWVEAYSGWQVTDTTGKVRDVWNVMKSPSSDTDPKTYAISLSHNVEYHQARPAAGLRIEH